MKTYKIYHIPGIKIGCSENPDERVKRQGYANYEILEEYISKDIASDRELQLQKQYGYTIDNISYKKFVNGKNQKKGGHIGGKISGKISTSRPEWKNIAKKGGHIGGTIRGNSMKFEELSEMGKKNRTLKDYQIHWIRNQYKTGKYSIKRIAKIFGIAYSTCHNIINYKSYKEV